jgi:hypothetical protein
LLKGTLADLNGDNRLHDGSSAGMRDRAEGDQFHWPRTALVARDLLATTCSHLSQRWRLMPGVKLLIVALVVVGSAVVAGVWMGRWVTDPWMVHPGTSQRPAETSAAAPGPRARGRLYGWTITAVAP